MMAVPTRMGVLPLTTENNPLGLSWHDSAWIPLLNPTNIMDYFSERSNPFYDRTCNNEIVKMQRLSPEQLNNMTGLEYILLHVQDPILYVIRKQHRHSATQATPLADYYIIAGTVYQAPDLASVLNSRLLSTVHHLQSSFDEASSYSRYHPSKGYTWDFKPNKLGLDRNIPAQPTKKETTTVKEEPSSLFQRQRVDMLLGELTRKFPIPMPPSAAQNVTNGATIKTENVNEKPASEPPVTIKQEPVDNVVNGNINDNPGSNSNLLNSTEIKTEPNEVMKPPPEKKQRLN